jgi:gliding motility-associated-like protein
MRIIAFFTLLPIFFSSYAQEGGTRLRFVENKNQWPSNVMYKAEISGGDIFLEKNRITYNFYDLSESSAFHGGHPHKPAHKLRPVEESEENIEKKPIPRHIFNVTFLNTSQNPQIEPSGAYPENRNYFIGNDPTKWASQVKAYNKIKYKSIYKGIDLLLFEKKDALKYEFHVEPGENTNQIRLQYNGADSLFIQNKEFHIITSIRRLIEKEPFSYQIIDGRLKIVPCQFKLTGNILSFEFPEGYDNNEKLIIDPEIVFSTYSGSKSDNWGFTATYDNEGHLYSGGIVFGNEFTQHVGYQKDFKGEVDMGILKFSPDGKRLIYATYLGGNQADVPISLIVNNSNELVILGITGSSNYPCSANAYQKTFNGGTKAVPSGNSDGVVFNHGTDIAISKLNASGSNLLASSYLGGNRNDGLIIAGESLVKNYGDYYRGEVIVDDEGNAYVASHTKSLDFPKTVSFPATSSASQSHAIVFKMNSDFSQLIFSTQLGGNGMDAAFSLQLDKAKNVYATGGTTSSNFAGMSSGYKGDIDGFVVKLSPDGNSILGRNYLGTSRYDQAYFIQLDTEENVFVLGQTSGAYPVTSGVYSNPNSGIFIQKLSNNLQNLLLSTVIGTGGNQPNISPTAFMVSDCNKIFLSGWGGGINSELIGGNTYGLPITSNAYQKTTNGSDFYLMMLDENASSLLYATYFGGNGGDHVDGGTSRFDKKGIIYQAVCGGCYSSIFPTTNGAYAVNNGSSNCNNAAFKFSISGVEASLEASPRIGCAPLSVTLNSTGYGAKLFTWDMGDGTIISTYRTGFVHRYNEPGKYTVKLIANNPLACISADTAEIVIEVLRADVALVNDYLYCYPDTAQLNVEYKEGYSYQWSPPNDLDNPNIHNPKAFPSNTTTYELTVRNEVGCEAKKTLEVRVAKLSKTIEYENITDCIGKPKIRFNNGSNEYFNFSWNFGDGNTSDERSPEHEYHLFDQNYEVSLYVANEKCFSNDTVLISIPEVFIPNLITPNEDGKNENYVIKGMTQDWHFDVYNRWGKAVYRNRSYNNEWGGEKLSDGIYYYLITTPRGVKCKGWVDVKR